MKIARFIVCAYILVVLFGCGWFSMEITNDKPLYYSASFTSPVTVACSGVQTLSQVLNSCTAHYADGTATASELSNCDEQSVPQALVESDAGSVTESISHGSITYNCTAGQDKTQASFVITCDANYISDGSQCILNTYTGQYTTPSNPLTACGSTTTTTVYASPTSCVDDQGTTVANSYCQNKAFSFTSPAGQQLANLGKGDFGGDIQGYVQCNPGQTLADAISAGNTVTSKSCVDMGDGLTRYYISAWDKCLAPIKMTMSAAGTSGITVYTGGAEERRYVLSGNVTSASSISQDGLLTLTVAQGDSSELFVNKETLSGFLANSSSASYVSPTSLDSMGDYYIADTQYGNMFYNSTKLVSIPSNFSERVVSKSTSLASMFRNATLFNQDIGSWDTSKITNMKYLFLHADTFNQDLKNWNTSSVTNMYGTFEYTAQFNGDISDWDTSNVTDMTYMFFYAVKFNRDISSWNTGKVTLMRSMFNEANVFNSDISLWDTSSVTDMTYMFKHAYQFKSDVTAWNTSKVTSMYGMFFEMSFNENLKSGWNVCAVTSSSYFGGSFTSGYVPVFGDMTQCNKGAAK